MVRKKSMSDEPAGAASVTQVAAGRLLVSGVLDFSTVNGLLDELGGLISRHGESIIDLSGVDRANSAGLALIVELKGQAIRGGRSLVFENVPTALSQIAVVCQVDELVLGSTPNPTQS